MPKELSASTAVAHQVETAIGQLQSLSTLPAVAAGYLPKLTDRAFAPAALTQIIELEPALAALALKLAHEQAVRLRGPFSLRAIVERLPAEPLRQAFLQSPVLRGFEGPGPERQRLARREKLLMHSVAVACCARRLATARPGGPDPELVYCAALLHDLGKLALEEIMPRGYARILTEAEQLGQCSCIGERQQLGLDHPIAGKHLAQRWHLPEAVCLAIWLHHSPTAALVGQLDGADVAHLVRMADTLVRLWGLADSGSYDRPVLTERDKALLEISDSTLTEIQHSLKDELANKRDILGLDLPEPQNRYQSSLQQAVAQLASRNAALAAEESLGKGAQKDLEFVTEFLKALPTAGRAIELATSFASLWQRAYQTGRVCLYLKPWAGSRLCEAVVVEGLGQTTILSLQVPEQVEAIPSAVAGRFAIVDAHEHLPWLFEQLEADFETERTKLMPLLCQKEVVGALVFELTYPADLELYGKKFETITSIAAGVLHAARNGQYQQKLAETIAQLLGSARDIQTDQSQPWLAAVAELAAGAAHELNNPLAVIAGRAQLLAEAEDDKEKKQILRQICDNANEASAVVEDLMSFAEPPSPRPTNVNVRQIVEEAVQLAMRKAGTDTIDTHIHLPDELSEVFVDSAQVVSALANVITNAVESYEDQTGPVEISACPDPSGRFIRLQVQDFGCGMDEPTLSKATHPFFSAKPAGRKRGMGLAYTLRFLQINGGSMTLASQPGQGTTVTLELPAAAT